MDKQQRIEKIQMYQKKWMPLHVSIALFVGLSFGLFLMNDSLGYLIGFFVALSALTYMEWRESRYLQSLTKHRTVKRLIPRPYVMRSVQSMLGALAIYFLFQNDLPLYMLVVFGIVVGMQSLTAQYYERKIRKLDPEQPSREDMRFAKV
ncbi:MULTISPECIES: hypothetical protein [unclassified Exiguobacterium]|uniref:hypothetical protein n=1 Tax=unclassified Exiguobacterium TaxID=2644629 RepID=UPI00103C2538|nr:MULTISPECIES: hypothetical protein [unclassified Exiguobacterium]TCI34046.1 hypothetical protein EVJ29_12535 [Exiguobacterium sp. SH4S7]TCI43036.1 hypothetical protein EVJ31_12810 [Exiguobacterium sp. SH5S32]TCI49822.1 hypothetical protein EVJ25_13315 [Exiguobacterium sp. SH1S4]TCI59405.1 hypothetical protein EVJ21_13780 [Exiguobacterium sp. SH0S2]TCI68057.1 hypothetical protein EVJ23_12800 [Exiguobacterium sp. SH1S1]